MQARYYDPVIGRFLSNDPVGALGHSNIAHGFNRYTYANNNPYKYVDPDGELGVLGFAIGFISKTLMNGSTTIVSAVTSSAMYDSLDGKIPTLKNSAEAAAYSLAGPGKQIGQRASNIIGELIESPTAKEAVKQLTSGIIGSVTDIITDKHSQATGGVDNNSGKHEVVYCSPGPQNPC